MSHVRPFPLYKGHGHLPRPRSNNEIHFSKKKMVVAGALVFGEHFLLLFNFFLAFLMRLVLLLRARIHYSSQSVFLCLVIFPTIRGPSLPIALMNVVRLILLIFPYLTIATMTQFLILELLKKK